MWHTDYGRERYTYFMFNFNLFNIIPWMMTATFLNFVCYKTVSRWRWTPMGRRWRTSWRLWCLSRSSKFYMILISSHLANCSPTTLEASLLTTFIVRWYKETFSFHLPFGEMTITLDNVSSLFHLPIPRRFFMAPVISLSLACFTVVRDLGVSKEAMVEEFDFNRGTHLRMSWLRDRYEELVTAQMYEVVVRVYILHLVVCTLFVDKSGVYIEVRYMWMFSSLDDTNWVWRCAALTILYLTLGVATIFETRQLAGYLSLLKVYLKLLFVILFLFNCYE